MSENIFEKIDKQSESIEKVADKLDGISIQDLYALAKRTWDYKDYETAQKYYNHISLLAPLEWKAPFYASLCGCLNLKEFAESIYCPSKSFDYYVATIEYIESLDNSKNEKNSNICEATKILLSVFQRFIDVYNKSVNKNIFDEHWPEYKENILKAFFDLIEKIEKYEDIHIKEIAIQAINEYLTFIKECCSYLPAQLTRGKIAHFIELSNYADKEFFDNMKYKEKPLESEKELTEEQKINIMVKGKCYLRYKDEVLAKKRYNKNLICGIIMTLCASVYTGFLLFGKLPWLSIFSIIPLLFGILFVLKAITQKNRIKIDSHFNYNRQRYRLTSDNSCVCESVFSPFRIFFIIIAYIYPYSVFVPIFLFDETNFILMIICIAFCVIISILQFVLISRDIPRYSESKKEFDYEGKTYQFKEVR